MPEDTSGKDLIRDHVTSILNEESANHPHLDARSVELEAFAEAIVEGLGLEAVHVNPRAVLLKGAYSRVAG